MHGVKAIGRTVAGLVASSAADALAISLTAAIFDCSGIEQCVQHVLKRLLRAGIKAGHFLNTAYSSLSSGDGT